MIVDQYLCGLSVNPVIPPIPTYCSAALLSPVSCGFALLARARDLARMSPSIKFCEDVENSRKGSFASTVLREEQIAALIPLRTLGTNKAIEKAIMLSYLMAQHVEIITDGIRIYLEEKHAKLNDVLWMILRTFARFLRCIQFTREEDPSSKDIVPTNMLLKTGKGVSPVMINEEATIAQKQNKNAYKANRRSGLFRLIHIKILLKNLRSRLCQESMRLQLSPNLNCT